MDMKNPFFRLGLAAVVVVFVIGLSACDNIFQIGLGDDVDIEAPRIQITGRTAADRSVATDYFNTDILVTGTATDDQSEVIVTVSWDDRSVEATVSGDDWSAIIPIDEVASDGSLTISAIATDTAGKSSPPATTSVQVDRKAPTVLVSAPQTYNIGPTNSDYIVIQGEAWDPSPVASVFVEVIDPSDSSVVVRQKAEGDRSWFTRILLTDGFTDNSGAGKEYRYRVLVTDVAGNVNSYQYHSSDFWNALPSGALFPSMVEIGQWDQEDTAMTDIDAAGETTLTASRISTAAASTTLDFTFNSNKDIPQISLSNLDESAPLNENAIGERVPIFASAIDDKEGINTATVQLEITFLDDPNTPQQTIIVPGSSFSSPGDGLYTSFEFALTDAAALSPGRYGGRITLADQKGTPAERGFEFLVDRGVPQIVSIAPSSNLVGTDVNGDVALQVRIQDDNPDATLSGTAADGADNSSLPLAVVSTGTSTTDQNGGTVYLEEFEVIVDLPALVPSTLHVDLEVRDASGLINSRSLFLTIDQEAPILVVDTPSPGASIGGDAMNVAGTSSADTLRVYLSFQEGATAPPADLSLWNVAEGNQTWSYQHDLSGATEGNFTIYAQSLDVAGNLSAVESVAFSYDFAAPTLTEDEIGNPTTVRRTALFGMTGTSSDTNGVTGIVVEQSRDGGAPVVIAGGPTTGDGFANWTLADLPRDSADTTVPVATDGTGDGSYEYQITATDVAGKSSITVIRNVVLDTVVPSVEITQVTPLVGADTVNGSISFSASVTDSNGVAGVQWAILPAGAAAPAYGDAANTTFAGAPYTAGIDTTALVDLTDYNLWIVAQDRAGNVSAGSFALRVDQSSDVPVVAFTNMDASINDSGAAFGNLQETNAKVTGTITDDDRVDASTITISVDGGAYGAVSQSGSDSTIVGFEHSLGSLAEGVHFLSIEATDIYGNTVTSPDVHFTIDKSAPAIAVSAPAAGTSANAAFSLTGTASDANGLASWDHDSNVGTAEVPYVEIDGVRVGVSAGSWSYPVPEVFDGSADGSRTYTLVATDRVGKSTTISYGFTVDATPPAVGITNPAAAAWLSGSSYTAAGSASDATSAVTSVSVRIDTNNDGDFVDGGVEDWAPVSGTDSWTTNVALGSLGEGVRTMEVRAIDRAGNATIVARSFGIDQTSPTTTVSAPASSGALFAVSGTATDGNELVGILVTESKDGAAAATVLDTPLTGTSQAWTVASLPSGGVVTGSYEYAVTITDAAGKTYETSVTTIVDVTPPTVSIAAPGANDQLLGAAFNPSGNASDVGASGIAAVEYRIDVGNDGSFSGVGFETWTVATGTSNWSASIDFDTDGAGADTGLREGEHALFVRATDGAGNVSTEQSVVFYVDQTAPTLTETTVGTVNAFKNTGFSLGGEAGDSNQLASITVTQSKDGAAAVPVLSEPLSGTTHTWSTGAISLPRDPATPSAYLLATGEYGYVITLTDAAGRVSQLTRTVTIDTAPPSVTITDPIPGTFTEDLFGLGLDGYMVNGTVTLKGNATDNQSVATLTTQVGGAPAANEANRYSFSRDIDTTAYATYGHTDGSTLTITVVATDAAGNFTTETYDMFVDQSSDNPTFELTNLDETITTAAGAPTNLLEFNAEIIGTAFDDDSVAASQILVQIDVDGDDAYTGVYDLDGDGNTTDAYEDESQWWPVSSPPGTDGPQVTFRQDLTRLPEGVHKFRLQIRDVNGTTTFSPDIYFVIDKSAPTIGGVSPASGTGVNADFTITGSISDTAGLKDITANSIPDIEWGTDGVSYTAVDTDAGGPATSAGFTIPITVATYGQGTQSFYLRATDIYGKTNVVQLQVLIDTQAPTVSYLFPASGTSINGLATVRGTSSDANQVTDVQYSLDGGTSWTSVAGDKYSWNFSFDTRSAADGGSPGLTQGAFTLNVRALDSAGNVSPMADLPLVLDQSSDFPVITLINLDDTITASGSASSNLLESNAKVQGTVTDDDWVDVSTLRISIDDGPWESLSIVGSSSTSVSFEHPLSSLADGVHSIAFQVSDTNDGANNRKGGLPAVQTETSVAAGTAVWFALDKSNPVVVISPPTSTYTTGSFAMDGTVSDGNDVAEVLVSTDDGLTYTSTGVTFITGPGTPSRAWSWSGTLSPASDGPFTLKVKGIDEFNKESITDLVITVDRLGPQMAISTPSAGATVNGPVNLSGTATETYGFSRVEIALDSNANGVFTDPGDLDWTLATGTYAWSYALDSTTLADGTYDLSVRGTDEAGNVSATPATRAFTISQASDRPSIELATVSLIGTATQNLLPGSLQISGTASDDDAVDVSSLQIRIDVDGDGLFTSGGLEEWAPIDPQPTIDSNVATWSHDFSVDGLTDGVYAFEMRAGDINFGGDYTSTTKAVTIGPVAFSVDTALPTGTVSYPAQGAFLTDPGAGTITLEGTASDANGVASVEISIDGAAGVLATGTTSWSYDYTIVGDGQVSYQVIITDTYGKVFTIDRYFTVDTTAPTPFFSEPAAGATVNGSLLVRGTTENEVNQVSAVYLWVGADGAVPPGAPATGDFTGWTTLAGTYNWSHRIDTTSATDPNGTYDVHVRAVDNAGNISADTVLQNLDYDQSTNLPVISFNNLTAPAAVNLFGAGGTISGSVSDDDTGDASSIQISFDGGTTWQNVTNQGLDGGVVSFSHDLDADLNTDGVPDVVDSGTAYDVRVRASDVAGVNAGDESQTTTTASYVVAVDRTAPTVSVIELAYDDPYGGPVSITDGTAMSGALINNGFALTSSASDPSGIKTMEISVDGAAYTPAGFTDNGDGTWGYDVGIDVTTHGDDGTFSLSVRATDTWDRVSTTSLSVIIDTQLPTVSYLQPGAGANVNGTVTVRGTSFDASALTSISIVGGTGTTVDLGNAGTIESWETTFDATLYDNATYATDNGDGTWAFPLVVTVEDAAGNVRTLTRTVNLDREGDKPVIVTDSLQPADGASVAGTIVMTSSVTDDDSPAFVRIYADLDDNGVYTDSYPDDLNADGDTADPFENEANYLEVAVSNGSWTTLVNENSEFGRAALESRATPVVDATGYVRFRFVPYDVNGLAGTPVERRIYIDDSAPEILGLNHANAELVRASVTLTGTIRDDADLTASRMKISFDGGTTYQNITITSGPTVDVDGYSTYAFEETIDTTVDFANASGNLGIAIQVTDGTFKTSTVSLTLNVDNKRPGVLFNDPETLPFIGTSPNEIYSFYGNNSTADAQNQLFGSATDTGVVSGVQKINAYFVKDGNFESPKSGIAPLTTTGNTAQLSNQSGTLDTIPFTESPDYVITIDNRIEQGQFDQESDIGDFDGFQESLRAKVGYDEWYAFFDTTVLPDGPLQVYFVAYDEAGNTSYGVVDAQSANYPPAVDSVTVGAYTMDDSQDRAKVVGTQTFTINASDAGVNAGIAVAGFVLRVTNKYAVGTGGAIGTEDTGFTPFSYTVGGAQPLVTSPVSGTATPATATVDIDTTTYASGSWYRFEAGTTDADGNIATREFYIWVNNTDSAAPVVTIDPFAQSNVDPSGGHIEAAGDSIELSDGTRDGEADLSGTVRITGTIYDDTSVSSLTLQISEDGGTTWSPLGTVTTFGTPIGGDPLTGYTYNWSYTWDTTGVTGNAMENVIIRASGNDGTNTTLVGDRPTTTVDVVPYITGITGAGFDSGLLTYVRRSARGAYPVAVGDTITITGYNLPGTAASSVSVGGTNLTPGSGTTTSLTVNLGATETSGDVTVATNAVVSRNNWNDDTLSQNQEPSLYNASLTDNRAVAFWNVGALAGTSTVSDAVMRPDGAGTSYDWMYTKNGTELYMLYGVTPVEKLLTRATGLSGGDFLYNEDGRLMFLFNHNAQWSFYNNTYAFTGSVQYGLVPDIANHGFAINQDEAYNWNFSAGFPKLGLGNVNFAHFTAGNEPGVLPADLRYPYSQYDLNRYGNLKIRTVGDGNAASDAINRVYVAYFDTGAEESRSIVFYGFQLGTDAAAVSSTATVYQSDGAVADVALASATGPAAWYANIDKYFETTDSNDVALAGTQKNNANGIATPRGRQEVTTANSGDDSSDFDLGVWEATPGAAHYGFIAYFDESADGRNLKITANESLYTADPTGTLGAWTTPFVVDAAGGADVAMAVESDGTIHLAYQSGSGYLKYANLTYNGGGGFTVNNDVFVDALFGAGTANAISLRSFGAADIRPVITTFSSAYTGTTGAIRLSYPLDDPAAVGAGASESTGAFTGNWETIALPAVSSPEAKPLHLFTTATGEPHVGYDASTLEEATFLGF